MPLPSPLRLTWLLFHFVSLLLSIRVRFGVTRAVTKSSSLFNVQSRLILIPKSPYQTFNYHCNERQNGCDQHLPALELASNDSKQSFPGFTPFRLNIGQEAMLPIDLPMAIRGAHNSSSQDAAERIRQMEDDITRAKQHLDKAQQRLVKDQSKYADDHRRPATFTFGDAVPLTEHLRMQSRRVSSPRFAPNYTGPFKIQRVVNDNAYELELPNRRAEENKPASSSSPSSSSPSRTVSRPSPSSCSLPIPSSFKRLPSHLEGTHRDIFFNKRRPIDGDDATSAAKPFLHAIKSLSITVNKSMWTNGMIRHPIQQMSSSNSVGCWVQHWIVQLICLIIGEKRCPSL